MIPQRGPRPSSGRTREFREPSMFSFRPLPDPDRAGLRAGRLRRLLASWRAAGHCTAPLGRPRRPVPPRAERAVTRRRRCRLLPRFRRPASPLSGRHSGGTLAGYGRTSSSFASGRGSLPALDEVVRRSPRVSSARRREMNEALYNSSALPGERRAADWASRPGPAPADPGSGGARPVLSCAASRSRPAHEVRPRYLELRQARDEHTRCSSRCRRWESQRLALYVSFPTASGRRGTRALFPRRLLQPARPAEGVLTSRPRRGRFSATLTDVWWRIENWPASRNGAAHPHEDLLFVRPRRVRRKSPSLTWPRRRHILLATTTSFVLALVRSGEAAGWCGRSRVHARALYHPGPRRARLVPCPGPRRATIALSLLLLACEILRAARDEPPHRTPAVARRVRRRLLPASASRAPVGIGCRRATSPSRCGFTWAWRSASWLHPRC